jgi:hydroxyethylthiazole kinase-like uncharacterized protein yjeF
MITHPRIARVTGFGGSRERWPLHDALASREQEALAQSGHPPHALMAMAGLTVARLALALAPHARAVRVWAGPGNNGGDGLVAARHLHQAGVAVAVSLLADADRLPADAAWALREAGAAGVPLSEGLPASDATCGLVIDALLGLGARRAPQGELAAAIHAMNGASAPVLAVDIPSGLHADHGTLLGAEAVRAAATVSLITLKPGCFTGLGRDHAGEVWLDSLGHEPGPPTAWLAGAPTHLLRLHDSHKGRFGDVAVVGGAPGMTGAAWLAARAALAAGAGRVFCCLLDEGAPLLDGARPELMGRRAWWRSAPAVLAATTVVCGCGGGKAVPAVLPPLLAHAERLVLDADALNAIAADSALRAMLQARAARGLPTLLTPHPLEAARLLGVAASQVQQDRLVCAQRLADETGAAVLLKGSGSITAAPGQTPQVNPTGNGALASAGTGDVLAGWCGARWAQCPDARPGEVAASAAWEHGHAADRWPGAARGAPLRAADLIEAMHRGGGTAEGATADG